MKYKCAAVTVLASVLVLTSLAPAHAEGRHHEHGEHGDLAFGLFAAVTGAAIAIAANPFNARDEDEEYYAPPPAVVYARPYSYAPVYQPRPVVVYEYPPVYAYPQVYAYPR